MDDEEWRTIPGHPDYDVSSHGRVRSWKAKNSRALGTSRLMSPYKHRLGYKRLGIDGGQYSVHRLVAAAWHGPCPSDMEVDHINHIRDDNRPENLRYLNRQQNLLRRVNSNVTHCKNKHPMSGDNLYIRPSSGRRECKACNRQHLKDFKARTAAGPVPDDVHGTPNGYCNHGCRCIPCKQAESEYRRRNRQRRAA